MMSLPVSLFFLVFMVHSCCTTIIFLSPSVNTSFLIGSQINVTWAGSDNGVSNVTIILAFMPNQAVIYNDGTLVLFALISNNGVFTWNIPLALNDYIIRNDYVFLLNNTAGQITSPVFSLVLII